MRILMLCHDMGLGGAQTHVYELCRTLGGEGHRVVLVCSGDARLHPTARALAGSIGVEVRFSPKGWLRALCFVRRICRRARKEGRPFDVLHAHTRYDAWLARLARLFGGSKQANVRHRRLPIVMTVHADYAARAWRKRLSYFGDCALCVSADLGTTLQDKFRYPPDRTLQTVNAVDTARFCPDPTVSRIPRRIVCLCRMESDALSGALAFLDCVERLKARYPDLTVDFLGSGRLLPSVIQKGAILNQKAGQDYLFFLGGVCDPVPFLQRADLALVSSRACLECMACGCAVIVSGYYGFGGLFTATKARPARDTNFTFRNGKKPTPEATAAAIEQYFSLDAPSQERLRRYNRAFVQTHYPCARLCADALDAYRFARTKPILLLGYYGYGNFGDEVSARAIRDSLVSQGHAVTVICAQSRRLRSVYGAHCVGRHRFSALWQSGALLLGGGSVLQDETSLRSLCYYLFWIALAKARGLRVLLYANGIGPIRSSLGRRLTARVLRGVRILCRDDASLAYCAALGLDCARCADATALLPVRGASFPRLCDLPTLYDARGRMLSAQSALCRPFCIVAMREGARYRSAIPDSFWGQVAQPVLFVALQECDLPLCRQLARVHGGAVCVIASHAQMCALLAHPNLSIVYSQRYHLLYYARRLGVPHSPICRSLKLEEFVVGTFSAF